MKSRPEATSIVNEGEDLAPSVFVILGAAVWSGGRASNAMRRRVNGALVSAKNVPNALFLVSGGVGKHPPSEAAVMAGLLRDAGVPEKNIVLDEASGDTLQSIRNCVRILKSLPSFAEVVVCSDVYHIPRCRWLFKLYGISTHAGQVPSGRSENKALRWWYYYLREIAAVPWDTILVLISLVSR
jgi:vancomycin permeability regulator SanA